MVPGLCPSGDEQNVYFSEVGRHKQFLGFQFKFTNTLCTTSVLGTSCLCPPKILLPVFDTQSDQKRLKFSSAGVA